MNDESCKHDSSKGEFDFCYREFKNLKDNNKIEKFERPLMPKGYVVGGIFGKASALYPKYYDGSGVANSQAVVSLVEENPTSLTLYKLEGLTSAPASKSREIDLLKCILADVKKAGVTIEWEIYKDHNFKYHQGQAINSGMILKENDEYWEVYRSN